MRSGGARSPSNPLILHPWSLRNPRRRTDPESGPGYFSRDGAGAIQNFDNKLSGADPGGGRWGARPPLGMNFSIQNALYNSIQAPDHHWAPTPGRNPVSAPDKLDNRGLYRTANPMCGCSPIPHG